MEVLGISKIDEGRRLYIPVAVLKELGLNKGDRVRFVKKNKVEMIPDDDGVMIDKGQRIYATDKLVEMLELGIGSEVVFIKEDGKITISKLIDRIR